MVRRLALLGLLLASCPALAAQLTATLDRRESILGEPLLLHLEARGETTLEGMDLSVLGGDFEVLAVTQGSEGQGKAARSRLEATLYPRRDGTLRIPPLVAGRSVSKPIEVAVKPDPDITLHTRFAQAELHERQQTLLIVEIRDRADRQWMRPSRPEIPGLLLRSLPESQREETEETADGPRRTSVREFRWVALALKADHYAAKLPMLDAYRLGTRLRLPLPVAVLDVHALPAYLPVAVPVGKPLLETRGVPRQASVGEPFQWIVRVAADGITVEGMKQLLRLPEGEREGLRFYAAQAVVEEDKSTGRDTLEFVVPVLPTRAGAPRLPEVTLPYFDPRTQRLEQVRVDGIAVPVSDPFRRRLALVGGALAAALGAGFAWWRGRRVWQRRRQRTAALLRVAQAGSAPDLAQAVCRFSAVPHPATLRQWLARLPDRQAWAQLVEELEQARFGAGPAGEMEPLKRRWLAALERRPLT